MISGTLGGRSLYGNNGQPIAGGVAIQERTMKQCTKCQEWKAINEFNKNRTKPDGLQGYCRECQRASNLKYAHSEKGKATRKVYLNSPQGKDMRRKVQARYNRSDKNKECQRRYRHSDNGKANIRHNSIKFKFMYPHRYKARKALNHAVEKGRIPRITTQCCAQCGEPANEYHHHKGYAQEYWLDVIPLCYVCHDRGRS